MCYAELVAAILKTGGLMYASCRLQPHPLRASQPFLLHTHTHKLAFADCFARPPLADRHWWCCVFWLPRSSCSNPGAATPYSLYKLYSKQAAATANPYTLRQAGCLKLDSLGKSGGVTRPLNSHAVQTHVHAPAPQSVRTGGSYRSSSPPRASFRVLAPGAMRNASGSQLTLSLTSLCG